MELERVSSTHSDTGLELKQNGKQKDLTVIEKMGLGMKGFIVYRTKDILPS